MCGLRTSLHFSFNQNLFSGIVYSIMSNKTLPYHYTGTGLRLNFVNSTKFPIFGDTSYVASVAEKWLP